MNQIRVYREKSGLTQMKTAERLGIRANAVSQWETGRRSPSVRHLQALAVIFNCSVDDLLELSETMEEKRSGR